MNWEPTMEKFMELADKFIVNPLMVLLLLLVGAGMFIGIPYGIYSWATYKQPETFSLRVDEWRCSEGHESQVMYGNAKTGHYWNTKFFCDQYLRK